MVFSCHLHELQTTKIQKLNYFEIQIENFNGQILGVGCFCWWWAQTSLLGQSRWSPWEVLMTSFWADCIVLVSVSCYHKHLVPLETWTDSSQICAFLWDFCFWISTAKWNTSVFKSFLGQNFSVSNRGVFFFNIFNQIKDWAWDLCCQLTLEDSC